MTFITILFKKIFDAELLFTDTDSLTYEMKRIHSKKHKLGTFGKIPLSCFDDKRYVLDDGIRMLVYFYTDSITSFKEIEKDCDKKDSDKEDCYN